MKRHTLKPLVEAVAQIACLSLGANAMLPANAGRTETCRDRPSRREFLRAAASAAGLTIPGHHGFHTRGREINCIMLFLVGGPSQIDTWDPKPNAPVDIRGPFQPIATSVPGMQISELFPRMAKLADKFSLLRSVHHDASAVHDTGIQLMQTGRLFSEGVEHPHIGSVVAYLKGQRGEIPAHVLLPRPIGRTGASLPHGQSAGFLGSAHDPLLPGTEDLRATANRWAASCSKVREALTVNQESRATRARYGPTRFGKNCLQARRLIERGVRFVTVNMFETVFDEATWDIHGARPFSDMSDLANVVAPTFDQAFSALLEDLSDRGLLQTTIVTALGEFGRTPRLNRAGGRDHHPGVWTIVMAGGPVQGGRIIGESDAFGTVPKSRPVAPTEVLATLYHGLGIQPYQRILGPENRLVPLVEPGARAIAELF